MRKHLLTAIAVFVVSVTAYAVNGIPTYDDLAVKGLPLEVTGTNVTSASGETKRALDVANISPQDFYLEVAKGNIPGHSIRVINGHNDDVGTTEETLWNEGGLYTFPAAATVMTLSSSSAADDDGSTGLTSVLVSGLDSTYAQISELVTMDGQSGVSTVNSYLRVNQLVGVTAGSGGRNAGIIYIGTGTITTGVPANIYYTMEIGDNISDTGVYTIPLGFSAYTVGALFTADGQKGSAAFGYTRTFSSLFRKVVEFDLGGGPVPLARMVPLSMLVEKTDIELRTLSKQASDVKGTLSLVLVEN